MTQFSKPQFTVIQDIIAHPSESPSLAELTERSSVEISTQDILEPVVGVEGQAEEVQIAL